MTVKIPSPTPITGVATAGGQPGLRRSLAAFQAEKPFAFALYVQALAEWQKIGDNVIDQDNVDGTSYFQVTGVHGVPPVAWQSDPTPPAEKDPKVGYCTHRSVLFIPWHRPYLMLYEQIIYAYAKDIAESATGYARTAYEQALIDVRLPYWDWSSDPHIPEALMCSSITLDVPGEKEGSTESFTMEHNPLYCYKLKSDFASGCVQKCMNWYNTKDWTESKRCPDINGTSHQDVADRQVGTFGYMKDSTFNLLLTVKDFDEFTTQAYKGGQSPNKYGSVESMHNNIHNYVGTNDSVIKDPDTKLQGSMTEVQASSFDPIFWLHHVQCDRLAALWQALNTNITINEWPSLSARYTANKANKEDGASKLEPWHKTDDRSGASYYIANDVKELSSTFENGYYYPETPLELFTDPAKMKAHTTKEIYKLYAPKYLRPPVLTAPAPGGTDEAQPDEPMPSDEVDLQPDLSTETWEVFVRVKNFALTGTWAVHVFLGDVPADSTEWFLSQNRVGSVSMLSTLDRDGCANCLSQAERDQLVTGTVPLTDALQARGVEVNSIDDVVKYLTDNLSWKVAKDTQDVPITDDFALIVGVSSQKLTLPSSFEDLPTVEDSHAYPQITAGKDGGLSDDNKADLQLSAQAFR